MRFARGHNNRGRPMKKERWVEEDRGYTTPCWIWQLDKTKSGYGRAKYQGRQRVAHRVAWEQANNKPVPDGYEIDHACRVRLCVNPEHLRLVTHAQNQQNLPPRKGCTSKYRGVCWVKSRQKWAAYVKANGKPHFLGHFTDEDEAGAAALEGRQRYLPYATD